MDAIKRAWDLIVRFVKDRVAWLRSREDTPPKP